ncbi:MAG: LemA family protein [Dethiobacteria bacterium]|jgi:LemA protein
MKKGLAITIGIAAIVLILLFSLIGSYNTLVNLDEEVNNNWSQVENQLQRRLDLIPNLVETVKGYAAHEREVIDGVSSSRAKLAGAMDDPEAAAAADQELSGALSRLLAIVENYPDLKADENFRQLQDELAGTENRIAVARMDYNNTVKVINAAVRRFPTVIIARLFGFDSRDYFEADEGAHTVPNVDFSN